MTGTATNVTIRISQEEIDAIAVKVKKYRRAD
jgi:hypothetical protein